MTKIIVRVYESYNLSQLALYPYRSQIPPLRQSRSQLPLLCHRSQIPLSLPPITNPFSNNRSQIPTISSSLPSITTSSSLPSITISFSNNRSQIPPPLPIDHNFLHLSIDHKSLHLSPSITISFSNNRSQIPTISSSLPSITNPSTSPHRFSRCQYQIV